MESYVDREPRVFSLTTKPFVDGKTPNGIVYDVERVLESKDPVFRKEYFNFFREKPIDNTIYTTIRVRTKMNAGELLLKISLDYKSIGCFEMGPFFSRFYVNDNSPEAVLKKIRENSANYMQPSYKKKPRGRSYSGVYDSLPNQSL